MKKIFENSQIKAIEKFTIDNEPITAIDLVERAATVFVNEFGRRFSQHKGYVYVFAGPGNNGADALAIARLLSEQGYQVSAYLINMSGSLSPECEANKYRIKDAANIRFTEVVKGVHFKPPMLGPDDIVIDGLFGSGLNRPLEGGLAGIVKYINDKESTVVSIDIPSGLFGEDNSNNNYMHVIEADLTLTFEFPQLAFLLPESAYCVGEWIDLPIGLHSKAIDETKASYYLITDNAVAEMIRTRYRFAHKGDFGHALLIAGSKGKAGAAVLAARSCMRSGVGLLTVQLPERCEVVMQTALPEAMVAVDKNTDYITSLPDISGFDAIGIGPGIGVADETGAMLEQLLNELKVVERPALVIDADALNIIAANSVLLSKLPKETILTPHPKEFDRIAGRSENSYERLQKARSIAAEQGIYIVLKGGYTAICTPSGDVFFNTTGNPGMATAGSGDVLTGIILGLLAQGYKPEDAAVIAVYLHGVAGDFAASNYSEESMLAGDITTMLGKVFKQMH